MQIGSTYRSTSESSYLKSYSSAACNVTEMHNECAVDCSRLGRNILRVRPLVCGNSINKHLYWKKQKRKTFLKIIVVFLSLPWMLLPNFKQIQWNLTVYHTVFLYHLHSQHLTQKNKFLFGNTYNTTLFKLALRALNFHVLAPATIV